MDPEGLMPISTAQQCPGCFAETGGQIPCRLCGYAPESPPPPWALAPGTLLQGQFQLGRVLGKPGGFGISYLAWDTSLATRVAIKEFLPRDLAGRDTDRVTIAAHSGGDAELFRYGLDQFLREARTLAQLDHPNIVRVRQFFEANGTAYLVMDYYDGLSLAEYLDQQGGRVPEQTATQLLLPILDGLRAVHAKGFLHRDVKPQNIYLAKADSGGVRPILLDFGAARQSMGERSRSLSVVISEGYAPFEQYQRKGQQGAWTDVYAAAAVLYRAVTGETPPNAAERIDRDECRPASAFGVSERLSDALAQALALEPAARPRSIEDFQARLRASAPQGDQDGSSTLSRRLPDGSEANSQSRAEPARSSQAAQAVPTANIEPQPQGNDAPSSALSRLSTWTRGWLYAQAAVYALASLAGLQKLPTLLDISAAGETTDELWPLAINATAGGQDLVEIAILLVGLITGISILTWISWANASARRLGATGMAFTPGWAIGWYFIPIANLWKPYQAMAEIWKASSNPGDWRAEPVPALIHWWWALWIGSSLLYLVERQFMLGAARIDDLILADLFALFSTLVLLALSLMVASLIGRVQALQDRHARVLPTQPGALAAEGSEPALPEAPIPAPEQRAQPTQRAILRGLSGPYAGLSVPLNDRALFLGRDPSLVQIVLADMDTISKRHALIGYDSKRGCFFLEDCGSSNGTFVPSEQQHADASQAFANAQRLPSKQRTELKPGERFYLSSQAIAFEVLLE